MPTCVVICAFSPIPSLLCTHSSVLIHLLFWADLGFLSHFCFQWEFMLKKRLKIVWGYPQLLCWTQGQDTQQHPAPRAWQISVSQHSEWKKKNDQKIDVLSSSLLSLSGSSTCLFWSWAFFTWWVSRTQTSSILAPTMPPALERLSGSPPAVCFPLFATHHLLLASGGEGSGRSLHPMPPRCCLRLPCWQLRVTTCHNCVCDVTPCLPGQTRNVWLRISQAWILCLRSNYWLNYPTRILCCLLLVLWTLGSEGRDANVQEHSPVVKHWNKLGFAVFLCVFFSSLNCLLGFCLELFSKVFECSGRQVVNVA